MDYMLYILQFIHSTVWFLFQPESLTEFADSRLELQPTGFLYWLILPVFSLDL